MSEPGVAPVHAGRAERRIERRRARREWWRRWPAANIGMRRAGGHSLSDLDGPSAPGAARDLERELGRCRDIDCPHPPRRHLYFTVPPKALVPCSAGKLAAGIDVRGDGGYVLVPPSRHADGAYRRHDGTGPAALPVAWLARLTGADRPPRPAPPARPRPDGTSQQLAYALAALDGEAQRVAAAPEGTRNATLNGGAFALANSSALVRLTVANRSARCSPRRSRSAWRARGRAHRSERLDAASGAETDSRPAGRTIALDAAGPPAGDGRKLAGLVGSQTARCRLGATSSHEPWVAHPSRSWSGCSRSCG